MVPLGFSLVSFIGIIVSSSSVVIFGEAVWSPIDLLGMFLDNDPSSATRFGVSPFIPEALSTPDQNSYLRSGSYPLRLSSPRYVCHPRTYAFFSVADILLQLG
jgi:cytosine/uracil/thiamine/allantoin permease